jgi:hypothetical protein
MLYLFQEDCKQPKGYTKLVSSTYIWYKTRQYNRLSHTHSVIIVNANYILNSSLKYLQSIRIYRNLLLFSMNSYTHWNMTILSSIDESSLPWRKSSTKYVFNSFLKLFKFTFGQSNDLILWKSVFLNSSYLSQLNKRSVENTYKHFFKVYNQIVYRIILWAFM